MRGATVPGLAWRELDAGRAKSWDSRGIARKVVELLKGWGMNPPVAFDPYANPTAANQLGVRLVTLDELVQTAGRTTRV